MNVLKKSLAIAATGVVPALVAAPANAEVLFDNTNTVGENPEYTGVAAYHRSLDMVGATLGIFTLPNPTEPHGGLGLTFNALATASGDDASAPASGAVQVSVVRVQTGVENRCDDEGIFCYDQTVYTLVPGTESATKTINLEAGTGQYSIDFDGYAVHGSDYAILFAGVPQGTSYGVHVHQAAPESMVGRNASLFFSPPDFTTFYQATGGYYASDVSFALKIETLPAVPEPDDYAMFLAGLALVGLAARQRTGAKHSGAVPVCPSMDA